MQNMLRSPYLVVLLALLTLAQDAIVFNCTPPVVCSFVGGPQNVSVVAFNNATNSISVVASFWGCGTQPCNVTSVTHLLESAMLLVTTPDDLTNSGTGSLASFYILPPFNHGDPYSGNFVATISSGGADPVAWAIDKQSNSMAFLINRGSNTFGTIAIDAGSGSFLAAPILYSLGTGSIPVSFTQDVDGRSNVLVDQGLRLAINYQTADNFNGGLVQQNNVSLPGSSTVVAGANSGAFTTDQGPIFILESNPPKVQALILTTATFTVSVPTSANTSVLTQSNIAPKAAAANLGSTHSRHWVISSNSAYLTYFNWSIATTQLNYDANFRVTLPGYATDVAVNYNLASPDAGDIIFLCFPSLNQVSVYHWSGTPFNSSLISSSITVAGAKALTFIKYPLNT